MSSHANIQKDGMAQAAMLSAAIGVSVLALVNFGVEGSRDFRNWVWDLGRFYFPYGESVGPYIGKEILMLASWLGSWVILHFILRNRELNDRLVVALFLISIGVATTMLWPPVTHMMVDTFPIM